MIRKQLAMGILWASFPSIWGTGGVLAFHLKAMDLQCSLKWGAWQSGISRLPQRLLGQPLQCPEQSQFMERRMLSVPQGCEPCEWELRARWSKIPLNRFSWVD